MHTEATTDTTTFNIIAWIRARRLRWVGHIMCLKTTQKGAVPQLKQTLRVIYDHRQKGDLLMDVEDLTWPKLEKLASDKDGWKRRVRKIKQEAKAPTKGKKQSQPPLHTKSTSNVSPSSQHTGTRPRPRSRRRSQATQQQDALTTND